jgi:hypothetical protein
VPQLVSQQFLVFLVFVIAKTCHGYGEAVRRSLRDCLALKTPNDRIDPGAFFDLFPFPPNEESGSKEKEQNRAARSDELLQLVVSVRPARWPRNQIFVRAFLKFGHLPHQGITPRHSSHGGECGERVGLVKDASFARVGKAGALHP